MKHTWFFFFWDPRTERESREAYFFLFLLLVAVGHRTREKKEFLDPFLFSFLHCSLIITPAEHTRTLKMAGRTHTQPRGKERFSCSVLGSSAVGWLDWTHCWFGRESREFLLLFCNRERSEGRGRLVIFCRKQRREMEMKVAVQFLLAQSQKSESWERWKFCCVISLRTVLSCCPERWAEGEGVSAEFLQREEEKNAWRIWRGAAPIFIHYWEAKISLSHHWSKAWNWSGVPWITAWATRWCAGGDESRGWKKIFSLVKISLIFNKLTLCF
jgi:hypothetical protein